MDKDEMDKKIIYRTDILCKKLYKHIINFIKHNNIKQPEDSLYVKIILKDVEMLIIMDMDNHVI